MCNEVDVNRIAEDIMEYLHQRPMASDTLDGVVHWWLLQQSIVKNKSLVERALQQLIDQDKVFKEVGSDRKAVYRLGPGFKPAKD